MKKSLLLSLAVLGFTSFSYAAPMATVISCHGIDELGAVGAFLVLGAQTSANLVDNYDTAHRRMTCKKAGPAIECAGNWQFKNAPAKVVFTKDAAGNVSASFARSPFYGGETVTLACDHGKPDEN